ncbi:hypothetical protein BDZ88DRAFT_432084 [Geranomyces variabilis]|nr:hypothetical protein BDZ88DRAFT_432084 [Geranomyces variabilis]KAJ3132799.1 hypothetical protein HDU90_006688 [Geranomyces variabilis]
MSPGDGPPSSGDHALADLSHSPPSPVDPLSRFSQSNDGSTTRLHAASAAAAAGTVTNTATITTGRGAAAPPLQKSSTLQPQKHQSNVRVHDHDDDDNLSDLPGVEAGGKTAVRKSPTERFIAAVQKANPFARKDVSDDIPYEVVFPCPEHNYKLTSNYIRTTKYTVYTFLPKTLYYQFRRFYNIYFLAGALSVIAGASSLSPASQILPLVIVLMFSLAKEAYEDYGRYKADRAANTGAIILLRNGVRVETTRQYIQPGDIVYLEKGDKSPVDAVILSSNYEDGTCFVETAELDGETNLKRRSAVVELAHYNTDEQAAKLRGTIQCEQPNDKLNTFDGLISVSIPGQPPANFALTPTNIVLRGSNIRNTSFVYALVVYTGGNTKIIRNLKKPKLKTSTLEKNINWLVIGAFVVNAALLVSSVCLEWRFYKNIYDQEVIAKAKDPINYPVLWYLGPQDDNPSRHVLYTFISFFGMYTYVIPISLFVSIEIVRVIQAKYIQWDRAMRSYQENSDGSILTVKAKANNSNLNEDLAVVEYVFSDKTGTVTRNEMKVIGWYLDGIGNVPAGIAEGAGKLGNMLSQNQVDGDTKQRIVGFGRALALCHNVIPAPDPRKKDALLYESQSPDESALLHGIKTDGFTLLSRTKNSIKIRDHTCADSAATLDFTQLALLDFTSDRKRMSIIVRDPQGAITLYCKGADNIVMERLAADQAELFQHADESLKHYSEQGFRTLVVAYRTLTDAEYEDFRRRLDEAERALTNREESIATVCEEVERELIFLGVTAIEDRLQDQVPETIEFLVECGIKVWLLTGDKMETAINIGMSSRLILPDMLVLILDAHTDDDLTHQVETFTKQLAPSGGTEPAKRAALIIPGSTLATLFSPQHPHLPPLLLTLSQLCTTVIACRVTPLQKALVVQLVQRNLKCTTLAIGDGANDVSMIQAAKVGVGVVGREGTQAVRAADYAIGEFRHLARLLTVHGRWSRLRLSSLVFYSFYKNLVMILIQWWFGFLCAWSGQLVYEEIFLTGFNIVFTSLPPLFIAIFDYDARPDVLLANPQLYKSIRHGLYWSRTRMLRTLVEACATSTLIFYFVYLPFHDNTLDQNGYTSGYYTQTYLFSTPMLVVVLIRASMMNVVWIGRWACVTLGVLVASLIFNLIVMGIVEWAKWVDEGTFESVHVLRGFWIVTFLVVSTCSGGVLLIKYFYHHFRPSDTDILQEESADLARASHVSRTKAVDRNDQAEMGVANRVADL